MDVKFGEVFARIMNGFGFAAIITFAALSILLINEVDTSLDIIWRSMLASMLMGAYYGVLSFLFQIPHWSPLRQFVTHFSLSVLVFLPLALWAGWLPLNLKPVLMGLLIFAFLYLCFWFGFTYYYRRITAEMNRTIEKK